MPFRFPRRGFPRGNPHNGRGRLPPYSKPAVFWIPASWDAPGGRALTANTYSSTIINLEEATPTAYLTQAATQDWVLKRLWGELQHYMSGAASNNNCFVTIHAGIVILDEVAAGIEGPTLKPVGDGTFTGRILWQRHHHFGAQGPGYQTGFQVRQTTDFLNPSGSMLDIQPNCRIRPDQRLCLIEYAEQTGSADAVVSSVMHLRPLVMLTTERRR